MGVTPLPSTTYAPAPAAVGLGADEVHVWIAWLDRSASERDALGWCLSIEERERASRFRFARDQTRFTVARAMLRTVLGSCLGLAPDRVEFRYGPRGKPALPPSASGVAELQFNLSHSGGLVLLAVTRDREIGIDVELVRHVEEAGVIADRFFSARETAAVREFPEAERDRAFFDCWVRKEAYIKGTGDGLAQPLDEFEVSLVPGEPARLHWVQGKPEEPTRWWLCDLAPAPGFAAALAVERPPVRIVWRSFDGMQPAMQDA